MTTLVTVFVLPGAEINRFDESAYYKDKKILLAEIFSSERISMENSESVRSP